MTDQERARDYVAAWSSDLDIGAFDPVAADAIDALVAEFAAVRLEERRAIVAWLRERSRATNTMYVGLQVLADAIEHGEAIAEATGGAA